MIQILHVLGLDLHKILFNVLSQDRFDEVASQFVFVKFAGLDLGRTLVFNYQIAAILDVVQLIRIVVLLSGQVADLVLFLEVMVASHAASFQHHELVLVVRLQAIERILNQLLFFLLIECSFIQALTRIMVGGHPNVLCHF